MVMAELEAMTRVDHPFIVGLHFSFQNKYSCYFVMDMRTGGDLRYYLKKKHIFEEKDVAFFVACLSSALMHIHSKNMIHRDIKPGN
jgi:serine/threonine protein kinase